MSDFLFRDSESQGRLMPISVIVPNLRSGQPTTGSSTLITSAPNSPSRVAQVGPAMKVAQSSTRLPASGFVSFADFDDVHRALAAGDAACLSGDRVGEADDPLRLVDDRVVHEHAVDRDRGGAGAFSASAKASTTLRANITSSGSGP